MPGTAKKIIGQLNALIELDFDAIEAYEAAIARMKSPAYRSTLGEYCKDHQRHTQNLANQVVLLGGSPARGPDLKRLLTKGKVVIADMVGDDKAILTAMRLNEEITNKAYELAVQESDLNPNIRAVLESNLADERRHRAWINQQLDAS